ncbi:winged helix-turn-helix domain-containing protein [Polaromonas sp. P1(28)-8]|nr:winged helix-turn-helix domain-containing protein [Polaromonas sp. P1(28)-8]
MRGIILGKLPDQLKPPFYLWTRQAVAQLAKRECGVDLSPTTVGRYLKDWGMTAQSPCAAPMSATTRPLRPGLPSNTP